MTGRIQLIQLSLQQLYFLFFISLLRQDAGVAMSIQRLI